MGRQVGFYALPEDLRGFVEFACARDPLVVTLIDSDQSEIEPLIDPGTETRVMTLWNRELVPTLEREFIRRPAGSDYYRISCSRPVLELSPSRLVSWNGQAALCSGRLYGFAFDGAPNAYSAWYEALRRWIRSRFVRNPVDRLHGYVGRRALTWFQQGGILLPGFAPPLTQVWLSFVDAQEKGRSGVSADHSS